jgi:hypothetical protein
VCGAPAIIVPPNQWLVEERNIEVDKRDGFVYTVYDFGGS